MSQGKQRLGPSFGPVRVATSGAGGAITGSGAVRTGPVATVTASSSR